MPKEYLTAVYQLHPMTPSAITALVRGQSVGHPTIRSPRESSALLHRHLPLWKQLDDRHLQVKFPLANFGSHDGINHLLSVLLGGQCDIDEIKSCRLVDVDVMALRHRFPFPRYGITGLRARLHVPHRPLFCGIIKPKQGLSIKELINVCEEMAQGGVDLIKEDEVLGSPSGCGFLARIETVCHALQRLDFHGMYMPCITRDGRIATKAAQVAKRAGAGAVHLNLWAGLGAYVDIRTLVEIPLFFQKSGDKVWTTGPFSMDARVLCKFVNLIGCDMAHVGMYGGYMSEEVGVLRDRIDCLQNTLPSFSCGMTPAKAQEIRTLFGNDLLITSGGYLAGHRGGIQAACQEFRAVLTTEDT